MPGSQIPGEAQAPLRIAPKLDMEHTKLTSTGVAPRPREKTPAGPVSRRDAFGNRIGETDAPKRPGTERRVAERRRPRPQAKAPEGFKMNRTIWLVALAIVALLISLAL